MRPTPMSENKRLLLFTVLVITVSILLFTLSDELSQRFVGLFTKNQTIGGPKVGTLTKHTGEVLLKRRGHKRYRKLATDQNKRLVELQNLDQLRLGINSTAVLSLKSGYSFELQQNSKVIIELWDPDQDNSPIYINQLHGEFTMLSKGTEGSVYISAKGNLYAPGKEPNRPEQPVVIKQNAITTAQPAAPAIDIGSADSTADSKPTATPKPVAADTTTLSNDYLNQTIARQASSFQKCQANAIRDGKPSTGTISVGMTITGRGLASEVRILSTTIESDPFKKCVTDIFLRLRFHTFDGPPIAISYPLTFE